MQSLFKPGSKINQDHKHKYIHILAYAASVVETWKKVLKVVKDFFYFFPVFPPFFKSIIMKISTLLF